MTVCSCHCKLGTVIARSEKRGNFNSQSRFILDEKQKKLVLKKNEYRQAPLLNLRDLTEPKNKSYIFQTDRA